MKLRKLIALLATLLMLVGMLPLSISAATDNRADIVVGSGVSVRDTDSNQRGLAFRFTVNVDKAQIAGLYNLVPNTGSIKPFTNSNDVGTLVETGAVLSYLKDVATGGMTLDDVDDAKTIQIVAQHVVDATEDSIAFAVRIVNIPSKHAATDIYARPYYIYEQDGRQVTVYGDLVCNNYTAAGGITRSLKVLAIGDGYAIDATKNHLYNVLKSADYGEVILGTLCAEEASLDQHWNYMNNGGNAYEYYKNADAGLWKKTTGYSALTALQDEDWDVITIQQTATSSAMANTYGNLKNVVNWIDQNKTNPDAKVLWHMTWANENDKAMYNAIVKTTQNTVAAVEGIDGIIPVGTVIQTLRGTALGNTMTTTNSRLVDTYGDYAAALTWYLAIVGGSLEKVTYVPHSVSDHYYNIARAVAKAGYTPYAVADLSETVLFAGSDFQADTTNKGLESIRGMLASVTEDKGYTTYDGFLCGGDYTLKNTLSAGQRGQEGLEKEISKIVNFGQVYAQGNHDDIGIPGLNPYGNNDPLYGPYGVFLINEDQYNAYGAGGDQVAADLTAYFNEKLANGWGNKPIFVMSHLPLHYNFRTVKDKGGASAMPIVEALNAASEAGLNIIFLVAHNHSSGYDDYLGGAAIYIPKGDSVLVADPDDYLKAPIFTELKFTYMNYGYMCAYNDMENGADTAKTISTFRIQADGSVIITRYDKDGIHNLKSAGKLSPNDRTYTTYTYEDDRVYASSRIVSAGVDEEYTGD